MLDPLHIIYKKNPNCQTGYSLHTKSFLFCFRHHDDLKKGISKVGKRKTQGKDESNSYDKPEEGQELKVKSDTREPAVKVEKHEQGHIEEGCSQHKTEDTKKEDSDLDKARALLNKSMEDHEREQYYSMEARGGSKEPIEVQPVEIKREKVKECNDNNQNNEKTPPLEKTSQSTLPISKEPAKGPLTIDFVKQSPHQILDTKFLQHLAEMHPVSALHELTHRLGWPGPHITLAFDCGPPFAKMYIFKAQVNVQVFKIRLL